jgi:glutaredoxin
MNQHDVVLYTRQGCCLCDQAYDQLRRRGLTPRLVDIDGDPHLREQYNHCVPVVAIDGKVRFRGCVNEVLLSRLLEHGEAASE